MKLPHALLIACLGAAPLCAQQVEQKTETPKPASAPGEGSASSSATGSANGGVKADSRAETSHRPEHANAMPKPEQKPVAYIGVLTREVPAELRAQFSLAEGFGLLVEEVLPDSPAKGAGLKVYDVLVKFEDQQLVNMEQFMALVRAKKKGDVVQLEVITGGKETKVPVTLGEHRVAANDNDNYLNHYRYHGGLVPPNGLPGFIGHSFHSGEQRDFQNQGDADKKRLDAFNKEQFERAMQELREYHQRLEERSKGGNAGPMFRGGEQSGLQNQGNSMQEHMERFQHLHHFQQELREYQERLQQWSKGDGTGPMPQMPMLNLPGAGQQSHEGGRRHNGHPPQTGISIPPGTDLERFNRSQSQSAANVTRRDDSGEYSLKNEDGKKTFIARPNNGKEQSWPFNTDAERQAVPQEFRDKLRKMDGAGSRSHIENNPGPKRDAPGNPPALPSVKAKTTSA